MPIQRQGRMASCPHTPRYQRLTRSLPGCLPSNGGPEERANFVQWGEMLMMILLALGKLGGHSRAHFSNAIKSFPEGLEGFRT